jgi:hypothetical protein
MGHRIVDAIIEDGQLKHIGGPLPTGRLKVHLIYDTTEEDKAGQAAEAVIDETWGIYKGIDSDLEARNLRAEWERGV